MAKKPIVFNTSGPLVVSIDQHNGAWDIHALASNGHFQKMKDRLKEKVNSQELGDIINADYVGRRKLGAPPNPRFKTDADHPPIIMREGETVRFVCDPAFAFSIWADRDHTVDPNLSAPSNPFGWPGAQYVSPGGSLTATVTMPPLNGSGDPTGPGPKDQGFFKFKAVVYAEGTPPQIITVDPDGYCDR